MLPLTDERRFPLSIIKSSVPICGICEKKHSDPVYRNKNLNIDLLNIGY